MLVAGGRNGKKAIKVYTCSWYENRGLPIRERRPAASEHPGCRLVVDSHLV